ncbi:MAG: ABC transporter substrate-binding protein [Burkholderiaceae bacterium]
MKPYTLLVASILLGVLHVPLAPVSEAKEVRLAYKSDATSLDSYQNWDQASLSLSMNFYDPLVDYDTDVGFIPRLATRWEQAEPTRWRFVLRQGVKFHDGRDFTADDVVFSAKRMLDPNSKGRNVLRGVKDVIAVDAHTVDFVTESPNPYLINQFNSWMIMSKGWSEANNAQRPADFSKGEVGYAATRVNGTGPFMLESREAGVRTVAVRNPNWWGNKEYPDHGISRITMQIIGSDPTRVAALLSGELDLVAPVAPQDVERIRAAKGLTLHVGQEARAVFLGMDQWRDELLYSNVKGKNPFKDVRVRRAIAHAIDTDAVNRVVFRGTIKPANAIIFEGVSGWSEKYKRLPVDLKAARALLAEAGYPNGFEVTLDCSNDREVGDAEACQALVSLLARIGIKVHLLAQTTSRWNAKILSLDTSMYRFSWGANGWASLNTLNDLVGCKPAGRFGFNMGGYCNKQIDELAAQARAEPDRNKRYALIEKAWMLVTDDLPYIPLYTNPILWASKDTVSIRVRPDLRIYWPTIRVK